MQLLPWVQAWSWIMTEERQKGIISCVRFAVRLYQTNERGGTRGKAFVLDHLPVGNRL